MYNIYIYIYIYKEAEIIISHVIANVYVHGNDSLRSESYILVKYCFKNSSISGPKLPFTQMTMLTCI